MTLVPIVSAALAASPPCPAGMLFVYGGHAVLGRYRPRYGIDQVVPVDVDLDPFCIDPYPFPGQPGDLWPEDGLAAGAVAEWEELLRAYGRRLCTVEELVWATAEGPANLPFLTGRHRGALCERSISWGDMKPIGAWEGCADRYGVHDAGVASSWARASEAVDDARGATRRSPYVAVGGTVRDDTYYARGNFGIHSHGQEDPPYRDDQLRVCADPGAWGDGAAWLVFREAAAMRGTFEGALEWYREHGAEAGPLEVLR